MRTVTLFASGLIFLVLFSAARADLPEIRAAGKIEAGSNPLQVDRYSVPTVADWNNDGKKDLIVGQYMWGHVSLFVNHGTDLNPSFDGGRLIRSGEEPIATTFS